MSELIDVKLNLSSLKGNVFDTAEVQVNDEVRKDAIYKAFAVVETEIVSINRCLTIAFLDTVYK